MRTFCQLYSVSALVLAFSVLFPPFLRRASRAVFRAIGQRPKHASADRAGLQTARAHDLRVKLSIQRQHRVAEPPAKQRITVYLRASRVQRQALALKTVRALFTNQGDGASLLCLAHNDKPSFHALPSFLYRGIPWHTGLCRAIPYK